MYIYVAIVLCLTVFSCIDLLGVKKTNIYHTAFFFASIAIISVAGFRYGLETDYWHYYEVYNQIFHVDALEPAFNSIIMLFRFIGADYTVFIFFVALLSVGIKTKLFSSLKMSFAALSLFFLRFYILFELNAIRQGLAIAFSMLAIYYYVRDNNLAKFTILTLISCMFHASAIFVFLIIPIRKIRFSFKQITYMLLGASIFRIFLLEKTIALGQGLVPYILSSSNNLIRGTQYIFHQVNKDLVDNFSFLTLLRIIISIYAYFYLTSTSHFKNCSKCNIYMNTYLLGSIINIVFMGYDTISYRLAAPLFCVEPLMFSDSLEGKRVTRGMINLRLLICIIAIFALDFYSFYNTVRSSKDLVPYVSIFSK